MNSYALLAFRLIAFSFSFFFFISRRKNNKCTNNNNNRNENIRTLGRTICWRYAHELPFCSIRTLRQALPVSHRCWAPDDRVSCEQRQISPNQKHWSITAHEYDRCPYWMQSIGNIRTILVSIELNGGWKKVFAYNYLCFFFENLQLKYCWVARQPDRLRVK